MTELRYKGYTGSAEVDLEGKALVGKLLFIRDLITYSATDIAGLEAAFREAVDDYLATCHQVGDQPEVPCKGSFNVRVGPQRHMDLALKARREGIGLNEAVCRAIDLYTKGAHSPHAGVITHKHQHILTVSASPAARESESLEGWSTATLIDNGTRPHH